MTDEIIEEKKEDKSFDTLNFRRLTIYLMLITFALLMLMIYLSKACTEDKVLWLILSAIGFEIAALR